MAHRISARSLWRPLALIIVPSMLLVGLEIYSALGILPIEVKTSEQVTDTFDVILAAGGLERALENAERGARRLVATGQPAYRDDYETALQEVSVRRHRLRQLTEANAERRARLSAIDKQTEIVLAQLNRAVVSGQQKAAEAARAPAATTLTNETSRTVEQLITQFVGAEHMALRQEQERAAFARREATIASASASAMATAVMFLGAVLLLLALRRASRAQATLRDSEERFSMLVESVKDYAILMLDPHGLVASWNDGARRMVGYSAEEIIGKHFSCFYPPEDVRAGVPADQLSEAARGGRIEVEGWRLRRDGSRFWADVVTSAMHDSAGNVRGFAKVARDMTERRQQQ